MDGEMAVNNNDAPLRRAHTLTVTISADDEDELRYLTKEAIASLRQSDRSRILAGSRGALTVEYEHNPEITHERYIEELRKRSTSHPVRV